MNTFTLGTELRDRVSGFAGIAHSRVDFMTGNVQYALQPPAKDGALPEPIAFDAHQLEQNAGAAERAIPCVRPPADTGIVLGEEYEDVASGARGIAVRKTTFLNGCVYYSIASKPSAKSGEFLEHFIEWKRLKRVGAGVRRHIDSKESAREAAAPRKSQPGGPSMRVPARG